MSIKTDILKSLELSPTGSGKRETCNVKPETSSSEPETRNSKPGTSSPTRLGLTNSDSARTPTLIYSDTSCAPSELARPGLSKSDQIGAKEGPWLMNIPKQNFFARFSQSGALAVSLSAPVVSGTVSLFFNCPIVDEKLTSALLGTLSQPMHSHSSLVAANLPDFPDRAVPVRNNGEL